MNSDATRLLKKLSSAYLVGSVSHPENPVLARVAQAVAKQPEMSELSIDQLALVLEGVGKTFKKHKTPSAYFDEIPYSLLGRISSSVNAPPKNGLIHNHPISPSVVGYALYQLARDIKKPIDYGGRVDAFDLFISQADQRPYNKIVEPLRG